MEFWSDIDSNYSVFVIIQRNIQLARTLCQHKLMFGQTTAKNGRKLSDVSDCNFRLYNNIAILELHIVIRNKVHYNGLHILVSPHP